MPRRIVAVGLGITLAGLFLTGWGASLGRVAEEVDTDPTASPDPGPDAEGVQLDLLGQESHRGPVGSAVAFVSAKLELTAFAAPTALQPPPMPAPPPPAAVPVTAPPPVGATGPGDEALEALRICESGGDYSAVSSGGWYRGAYQFSQDTWDSVASRWRPDLVGVDPAAAAPADQDAMASAIYDEAGGSPWPNCGRHL